MEARRGRMVGPPLERVKRGRPAFRRPPDRQIGLLSTSRMKAAPTSHARIASSTVGAFASGPTRIAKTITPITDAPMTLARRSRISPTRLDIGWSDCPPALERPDQRHLVGIFEVAADRQASGDPADAADGALEPLGQIHRRRLALECRVRREDDLLDRLAGALR